MLGNEKRMQPMSKVTHHGSEATTSRRIRRVHEDLRAHQSTKTDSRQALTHIHDMGVHLAAFSPKTRPNGLSPQSAGLVLTAHGPHHLSDNTWRDVDDPQRRFGSFLGQEARGSLL